MISRTPSYSTYALGYGGPRINEEIIKLLNANEFGDIADFLYNHMALAGGTHINIEDYESITVAPLSCIKRMLSDYNFTGKSVIDKLVIVTAAASLVYSAFALNEEFEFFVDPEYWLSVVGIPREYGPQMGRTELELFKRENFHVCGMEIFHSRE